MKRFYFVIVGCVSLFSCSELENEFISVSDAKTSDWLIGDSVHWAQKYIYSESMLFASCFQDIPAQENGLSWREIYPSPYSLYVSEAGIFREPNFLYFQSEMNIEEAIYARKHNLNLWVGSNARVDSATGKLFNFFESGKDWRLYCLSQDSIILQEPYDLVPGYDYKGKCFVADGTYDVSTGYFFSTDAEALEYVRSFMPWSENTYWKICDSIRWARKYTHKKTFYFDFANHRLSPGEVDIIGGELTPYPKGLYISERGIFREPGFLNPQEKNYVKEVQYVREHDLTLWVGGDMCIDAVTGKWLESSVLSGDWSFFMLQQDTILIGQPFAPNVGYPYHAKCFVADDEYDVSTACFFESDSMAIRYVRDLMQ